MSAAQVYSHKQKVNLLPTTSARVQPPSLLKRETLQHAEEVKSKAVNNKRLKKVDGTASSVQSPTGLMKPSARLEPQLLAVPDTDPCHERNATALEAASRSSNTKLFYMGLQEHLKVHTPQHIATRQLLAAMLNSAYDFKGIKCGKGLKLNVIFVDAFGNKAHFPAISSTNQEQNGSEVLPDGTSWLAVSSKAKAIYVHQDEYQNLQLPKQGVPPYSQLHQYGLHAP